MQNLPNIATLEFVVVASALLILSVAPALVGWSDRRRRRKTLAASVVVPAPVPLTAVADVPVQAAVEPVPFDAGDVQRHTEVAAGTAEETQPGPLYRGMILWDEPTVTIDAETLEAAVSKQMAAPHVQTPVAAPPALLAEPPAAAPTIPPSDPLSMQPDATGAIPDASIVVAPEAPPPAVESVAVEPPRAATDVSPTHAVPRVDAVPAAAAPAPAPEPVAVLREPDPAHYRFTLQDLRRVRLPNWPPATVVGDAARHAAWREAERLVAARHGEIDRTVLHAAQPPHASCLGSAEVMPGGMRLHFLLFPTLWPSTAEEATAEAVFEIDDASGGIRSAVYRRPPPH